MIQQTVIRKLNSNRGASLMVALLFFVMCATVGAIILTAATASGGRLAGIRDDDKTYYAVTSAARVIIDKVTAEEAGVEFVFVKEVDKNNTTSYSSEFLFKTPNNLTLMEYVVQTAFAGKNYDYSNPDSTNVTQTVTFSSSSAEIPGVTAEFTIDKDLNLYVSIFPSDSKLADLNNITLYFVAHRTVSNSITQFDMSEPGEDRATRSEKTINIKWEYKQMMKG